MNQFAGCCKVEVFDKENDITFPTLVMYPTNTASTPVAFGPFSLEVAMDAPIAEGRFPVVIISHGSGGSNLTHRTLGMHLAMNGFVVCMPEHPFNNRHNNDLQYTVQNMIYRPLHIRVAIDEIFSHEKFKSHLDFENVAIIGHSVGGYTALALAGGAPHTQALAELCQKPASAEEPYWIGLLRKNGITSQPIAVTADRRVKALVLFGPDVSLFMSEGALREVHAPVLLLVAEKDYMPQETIAVLRDGLPERAQLTYRVVKNAGHYSFLSPFPEAMKSRVGEAAKDPAGFDREKFHQELNLEVLSFLQKIFEGATHAR
ncbi:MAG: dienelactone hydrolase family protein [candidate division KSB1 bacterium]|nr:dienelactone hydrolase family protein [candidate division KSB1 bacterium]MDZ7274148.1 dienelactone hydrolase family protein [candidate division KSB1 bacterium]MDZ7287807.1 dienelactone hydrolase family protein [candidate division KSB1 bacterium]MDZ7296747.1 dienelactone hydrolase family protein [candidate division KSB1 bacterium]MDZ7347613.1 dienelactone hydrolase family protein [candidate division KSB1 bacterium]